MSFWDVVWFIIISFAFVAYLMVLFSILGDLFRDRAMSGWVKAVWIIALIVFRSCRRSSTSWRAAGAWPSAARKRQPSCARRPTPTSAKWRRPPRPRPTPDQIVQARKMLDEGVISQPEYDRLKAKALA